MPDLLAVEIGEVGIHQRAQQQQGRLSGMGGIDADVLSHPVSAAEAASRLYGQFVLVCTRPASVVQVGARPALAHSGVALFQQLVPALLGLPVGLHRGPLQVGIGMELGLGGHAAVEPGNGVGRQPRLDGRPAPTALHHALHHALRRLRHPFAQEVAQGRKAPGPLFRQGYPSSAAHVVAQCIQHGLILHAEQAHAVGAVAVNLGSVLRIDALHVDIDVRLAAAQPHVAHPHVGHLPALASGRHRQPQRPHSLQGRQFQLPASAAGRRFSVAHRADAAPLGLQVHVHRRIVIGPPPDADGLVALQHHAVGKHPRQAQRGTGRRRQAQAQQRKKHPSHILHNLTIFVFSCKVNKNSSYLPHVHVSKSATFVSSPEIGAKHHPRLAHIPNGQKPGNEKEFHPLTGIRCAKSISFIANCSSSGYLHFSTG